MDNQDKVQQHLIDMANEPVDFQNLYLEFYLQPEVVFEDFKDLMDIITVEFTTICDDGEREIFITADITPKYETMGDRWGNTYLKSIYSYRVNITAIEDWQTAKELDPVNEDVLESLIRTKLDELLEM